jgi:hypothetical protein
MKIHGLTTMVALLAVVGTLAACGARRDEDERRRDTYRIDTTVAHREFEDGVKRRLEDLDRKVAELRSRANTAAKDEAKRLNDLADDIAELKDKAVNKLNDLRESASDKWDDVRVKVDKAIIDAEDKARDAFNMPK